MGAALLRTRELRSLLDALDRLYQPVEPAAFPAHLFGIIAGLLPGAVPSFDAVDLATGTVESHITADVAAVIPVADLEAAVRAYLWQNPSLDVLVQQPSTVVQLGDLASQRELRRTDFYQHCFRPLGIKHQLAAGITWPGHVCGFVANRGGSQPFSDREVEIFTRLRPHVGRAFASVLRWEKNQRHWGGLSAGVTADSRHSAVKDGNLTLTEREAEVLHWLSAGKRNGEIAALLDISPRTVHKHVEHIFSKLRVETRTAAAAVTRLQ